MARTQGNPTSWWERRHRWWDRARSGAIAIAMLAGSAVLGACGADGEPGGEPDPGLPEDEPWTTPRVEMPASCLGDEVALEDFFDCRIRARCDVALRCLYDFDSEEECLERKRFEYRWEPQARPLERGTLVYDPAGGAACIRAMLTGECTGPHHWACIDAFTTTLSEGDPCFSSTECGWSGECIGCDAGECCQGICAMDGGPGEVCDETARCALGLRCDPDSRRCFVPEPECAHDDDCPEQHRCQEERCVEAVAEGGACFDYGHTGPGAPPPDYQDNSNCAPGLSCVEQVCRRTDHVGAPCSQYEHCWGGLQCAEEPGSLTGTCQPRAAVGERCGDDIPCLGSTRCDSLTGRCVPRSGPGEPCDGDWDCSGELRCWWVEGTCNPPKPEGAPCTAGTGECEAGLDCRSGDDVCLPRECYPE